MDIKACNNLLCPDHLGVTVLDQTVPAGPRACEVTRAHGMAGHGVILETGATRSVCE